MTLTAAALPLLLFSQLAGSAQVRYFPGSYFNAEAGAKLERKALESWPGPTALRQLWEEGGLDEDGRVALLLGAAAFHDRQLLRLYSQGVRSDSPRVRQAAAYGYRRLIGDRPVNVAAGVSRDDGVLLRREMWAVFLTLREAPLVELWLSSLLAVEGARFPGWRGVVLERDEGACLAALEELLQPEDLPLLVEAYQLSARTSTRISLLRLIEAFTLRTFLERPRGASVAWGPEIYTYALSRLDAWLGARCAVDAEFEIAASLRAIGVRRARDPLAAEGCQLWPQLVKRGKPQWWALASRQAYRCGGPAVALGVLTADRAENQRLRKALLRWYRIKG